MNSSLQKREQISTLAVQGLLYGITVERVRNWEAFTTYSAKFLTDEQVEQIEDDPHWEHELYVEAVGQAKEFYETKAGGSHDLSSLEGFNSFQTLEALPTATAPLPPGIIVTKEGFRTRAGEGAEFFRLGSLRSLEFAEDSEELEERVQSESSGLILVEDWGRRE